MNLLEHYIISVISEKPLDDEYLEVTFLGNCWGDKRNYTAIVTKRQWDWALKNGYIML